MKKHIDLVGTLYVIAGALSFLIGLALLSLAISALALVRSAGRDASLSTGLAVGLFTTVAAVVLLWAVAHVWNGLALRRFGPWARAVGIVLAVLNLFVLPFGTALGSYSLWVLLNEQSRPLFDLPRA